ncbi:MAG TPA: hypothetical protein VGE04_11310 [Chloroflexia bacterium]|jgi:hypothetical protein
MNDPSNDTPITGTRNDPNSNFTGEAVMVDAALVPDPDAEAELGPGDLQPIADEDVRGSRLLVVRRAVEVIDLDNGLGGAVQFACTFQPTYGTRFTWASLVLQLQAPQGVYIIDLSPHVVREDVPVNFTVDRKGKIGLKYEIVEAGMEAGTQKEFATYHCTVQGSGEGTALARWDFRENPYRQEGLGREQVLALSVPVVGNVTGTLHVSARLERRGLGGVADAIRDLVLGPDERHFPITFDIPQANPAGTKLRRFLRPG